MIDLVIHYGDPFVQKEERKATLLPSSCIAGQKLKTVRLAATGETGVLLASLYPWGASAFFDLPICGLNDAFVDLKALVGAQRVTELEERIRDASSPHERVRLFQRWLLARLDTQRPDSLVQWAVCQINAAAGRFSVGNMARELGLSRRQLIRRFKRSVGLSPKQLAGVIRFQKVTYYIRQGLHWSDVIFACGFVDQPHLIKDFTRYAGCSPGRLSSRYAATPLGNYFNADRRESNFYNTIYL